MVLAAAFMLEPLGHRGAGLFTWVVMGLAGLLAGSVSDRWGTLR